MDKTRFTDHILIDFLLLAVPMQIMRIKSGEARLSFAPRTDLAIILGEKGDALLYGGKGCREAFNALVEGIATCAFAPGGITIFGLHFEETMPRENQRG